ncbi:MAG: hypothetical protein GY934_06485, partial [Gammaproteobacteria bacterium]|nr:hypothetical protein [Gammaproteobacteria bacterium]
AMYVRTLDQLHGTAAFQKYWDNTMTSVDLLSVADGIGFSLHDVRASAGLEHLLWYKHHWEANYIVSGNASVENLSTGEIWHLGPGAIYMVGPNDRHHFTADTDVHLVSIFNPALSIGADYDEEGTLAPSGEVPDGRDAMFFKTIEDLHAEGREKVVAGGSARLIPTLLQEDGMGFTLSDVRVEGGNEGTFWYKHHWVTNYILEGCGRLTDLSTGKNWEMKPGTIYMVGPEDQHNIRADTDLHMLSVFNPPLRGDEQYDTEGTLPPSGPLPAGMS